MDAHAADHETRLEADDHFALKLWLRILTCSNLIEARIRHNLRRDFDCTLPRFDLLAQLDRIADRPDANDPLPWDERGLPT